MTSAAAETSEEPRLFYVLVLEDEYFIADDLARNLAAEGLTIVGPVATERAARSRLDETRIDFAVLDIDLQGAKSFGLAAELRARGVPFLFLTGYDRSSVPKAFDDVPILQKPQDPDAVVAEIRRYRRG